MSDPPVRITRFGAGSLTELADLCDEIDVKRPMLVATRRGAAAVGELPVVGVYDGVGPHVPVETVHEAAARAQELGADGLVGLGGGSATDTCKAVVAELASAGRRRSRASSRCRRRMPAPSGRPTSGCCSGRAGRAAGATPRAMPIAAIYDPELTLDLPIEATVGTAMNALAHCAEAYYHPDAQRRAPRHADTGATAIGHALPLVVASPREIYGRTRLLEGAMRAAFALGDSGVCLAHAMAQALGGRYGLPQGAMNAVCLPAALRFNQDAVPEAVGRLAEALGTDDAPARVVELARLGGFERLRDFGIPEAELDDVAAAIVARPGAKANPRPATADEVAGLLRSIW